MLTPNLFLLSPWVTRYDISRMRIARLLARVRVIALQSEFLYRGFKQVERARGLESHPLWHEEQTRILTVASLAEVLFLWGHLLNKQGKLLLTILHVGKASVLDEHSVYLFIYSFMYLTKCIEHLWHQQQFSALGIQSWTRQSPFIRGSFLFQLSKTILSRANIITRS